MNQEKRKYPASPPPTVSVIVSRPSGISSSALRHKTIGSLQVGWGTGKYYFLAIKGSSSISLDKVQALELAQDLIEYGKS